MPDSSQYPPGAQAVDQNLFSSVEGLRNTVETGFDRIDRRMDSMVTKDAHLADVARLDQRIDHTDEKIEQGLKEVKHDMAQGFAELRARDAARDADFEKRENNRFSKQRWVLGWGLTAAGILSGIVFGVINLISGT